MMIDNEKRNRMSVMLRQLGSGAMSIAAFEQLIEEHELAKSNDRSLTHIISFASTFYDDDSAPVFLARFRGKYSLKRDDRRRIAIAVVFLRSDCEYQWPDDFDHPYMHDFAFLWLCALATCASFMAFALTPLSSVLFFVGIALIAVSIWLFRYAKLYNSLMHDRWKKRQLINGRNYDVWPFVNDFEYDEALRTPWLLAGA